MIQIKPPEKPKEPAVQKAKVPELETPNVRFVLSIPGYVASGLEAERAKRGFRSRAQTIRFLLSEALGL